ncbi:probable E3 ubiquitin-protein ligase makorin-1 [Anthonomus grandis grandis]|uniref:probable E3 ubiquitin-protein ligase makorin-1 n=1 Tax=Anthonomus grandis grandis TaxID=2921223 RepID=UPI00216590E0|nr:probable E3 ubiquitin-protein ligase makorin-1 [Anthonomus grandis grandis]
MADRDFGRHYPFSLSVSEARPSQYRKYCLCFFQSRACPNGANCQFEHKLRHEVEPIAFLRGSDFFLGQAPVLTNQRSCYFHKIGACMYKEKCRFLHDSEPVRNNQQNSGQEPTTECDINNERNANQPSTSSQLEEINLTLEDSTEDLGRTKRENEEALAAESEVCKKNWVDAPEFVPRGPMQLKSYAQALNPNETFEKDGKETRRLCPYTTKDGICVNVATCTNVHGGFCDMCERFVLHPYNDDEKKKHQQECIKQHEKNMELSFAVQRSKEKTCGVCFEIIMEKPSGEQRFGILPNCSHCFCLTCIRKWRQARQFENKIIRACPECRVTSDFVCPSMYWVDTKEDKEKLIEDYKNALSRKDCKYFKRGDGKCPFGNKCFYMHATADGNRIDVGPPPRQRRHRSNDSEFDVLQVMLWDFLDERDFPWQSLADDIEDLVAFFTDSDESDWSDYELFLD